MSNNTSRRRKTRITALTLALGIALATGAPALAQTEPVPTPQQTHWQNLEFGVMVHFGLKTYVNKEHDDGHLSARLFNPAHADPDQWAAAAKAAGAKYLILVARHGDGFALWPTSTSHYSVASSPWKHGHGDLVRLTEQACRKYGLGFGIYLAPSDTHYFITHPQATTADYEKVYLRQLDELASNYGPLVEWWFDGSGPKDFDFGRAVTELRTFQPNTQIFAAVNVTPHATIRWVGNEAGRIEGTNWNAITSHDQRRWLPVEVDTPLQTRDQWYWHTDSQPRSLDSLLTVWDHSVGRGGQLLMGLSPDRDGRLPAADVARLEQFGRALKARYGIAHDLALHHASVPKDAANVPHDPARATDGDTATMWSSAYRHQGRLTVTFTQPTTIDTALTMEWLVDGQHVRDYRIQARVDGHWRTLVQGHAIGHEKIDHFAPVTTREVRLDILDSNARAHIREFELFDDKPLAPQA
ncbi:MAG TPA: alpha-L-fucosidase [Rhodanobacteraceae bacterium]